MTSYDNLDNCYTKIELTKYKAFVAESVYGVFLGSQFGKKKEFM